MRRLGLLLLLFAIALHVAVWHVGVMDREARWCTVPMPGYPGAVLFSGGFELPVVWPHSFSVGVVVPIILAVAGVTLCGHALVKKRSH